MFLQMEREADFIGLQLMSKACYDPREMPAVSDTESPCLSFCIYIKNRSISLCISLSLCFRFVFFSFSVVVFPADPHTK